jgi:hypothetical protein
MPAKAGIRCAFHFSQKMGSRIAGMTVLVWPRGFSVAAFAKPSGTPSKNRRVFVGDDATC